MKEFTFIVVYKSKEANWEGWETAPFITIKARTLKSAWNNIVKRAYHNAATHEYVDSITYREDD